jgi:hypothetical protein
MKPALNWPGTTPGIGTIGATMARTTTTAAMAGTTTNTMVEAAPPAGTTTNTMVEAIWAWLQASVRLSRGNSSAGCGDQETPQGLAVLTAVPCGGSSFRVAGGDDPTSGPAKLPPWEPVWEPLGQFCFNVE